MQYAQVLTEQKTRDWDATFTYEISPEILPYIKIGSLVEVPFANKKVEGIIVDLKKSVPSGMKLKKIARILQPNLIISTAEIEFSKWLARHYLTTWSEALFAILPPIPKKDITEKINFNFNNQDIGKQYILSDFNENRYDYYLKILKKNHQKSKSVWIIFPDLKILEHFLEIKKTDLEKYNVIKYTSSDNLTTRFKKWQTIRSGKYDLLIGSRLALLSLPNNVATIIIDEPSQSGHQEDQSPRYHSLELANYWQRNLGINILSGDLIPSLKNLVQAKNKEVNLLSKKIIKPPCTIQLIEMTKEKKLISFTFERALLEAAQNKKNMLIYLPKKGMGSITRCKDCGYTFNCPKCGSSMTFHLDKNELFCHQCSFHQTNSAICPNCKSNNISTYGLGLEKVASIIKNIIGNYPIIVIDKEHELKNQDQNAIYISTQAAFRYSLNQDISVMIDADLSLNNPEYKASEELFYLIIKLAASTKEQLLIQTHEPHLNLYQAINNKKYQLYLHELLKERFINKYPPYGNLIKITSKNKPSQIKFDKIESIFPDSTQIGPVHTEKGFSWILKSSKEISRIKLREFISTSDRIEFDPSSL